MLTLVPAAAAKFSNDDVSFSSSASTATDFLLPPKLGNDNDTRRDFRFCEEAASASRSPSTTTAVVEVACNKEKW